MTGKVRALSDASTERSQRGLPKPDLCVICDALVLGDALISGELGSDVHPRGQYTPLYEYKVLRTRTALTPLKIGLTKI